MDRKIILLISLMLLVGIVGFVSAMTYSENQEVTLAEGGEVYVQIQDASYKMFLDPYLRDKVGFEINGKQNNDMVGKGGSIFLDNGIIISVIDIYQIDNKGYVKFIMSSQTPGIPTNTRTPTNTWTKEYQDQRTADAIKFRQQQEKINSILFAISYIVSLIIGIILIVLMIKNPPKFAKKMKYAVGLFSGGFIASVLAVILIFAIGVFRLDVLTTVGTMIGIGIIGAIGSFVLGIIGFFIDKAHN